MGLGSGGSRLRPSDMNSGKKAFMSHQLKPVLLEPPRAVLPGSNPLRRT